MTVIKKFPMLYGIASNGKIKTVQYWIEELADGTCDIVNEHGYIDGKKQIDRRNIKVGKNLGKKNETSIQDQALSEAESKFNKKKDSNYTENASGKPSKNEHSILPMLAQTYSKINSDGKEIGRKRHIKLPCIVQPKLNGVRNFSRILAGRNALHTSRKFKEYTTLSHLDSWLTFIFPELADTNIPLDGEIYKHGASFQQIVRLVKKWRPGQSESLEYWVYDIADPTKTNKERNEILVKNFNAAEKSLPGYLKASKVKRLPSYIANCEQDIYDFHDKFVKGGYEGIIIRNMDGKYVYDYRSNDLQKYKKFIDEEFEIVDYKTGKGRETDAIVFICKVKKPTASGPTTFEVRPIGSIEDRRALTKDFNNLRGKELTVRYQEASEDNVPIFPVGVIVRDYE